MQIWVKKLSLIDADLRKPVIHKMFENQTTKGFTNFLSGNEKELKNIFYNSDDVENYLS